MKWPVVPNMAIENSVSIGIRYNKCLYSLICMQNKFMSDTFRT